MRFLDPKEEVYKIKLTPYGSYLLSQGKFNPEYYAFFDNDVIYDLSYLSGTGDSAELQNNIQKRILDETPRFEGQTSFEDCETTVFSRHPNMLDEIFPGITEKAAESEWAEDPFYKITITDKPINNYYLLNPMGQSDYNTDKAPYFNMHMLTGAIHSASIKGSGISGYFDNKDNEKGGVPTAFIKQVEINTQNEIHINNDFSSNIGITPTSELDNDELFDSLYIFKDGSSMNYDKKRVFFKLEEGNTRFLKENFDIEVYEISPPEAEDGSESLLKLSFVKEGEVPNFGNVEYYFNILLDNEIDKNYYCDAIKDTGKNKTKDIFSDNTFKCPEEQAEKINLNIYNTDQITDPTDKC
tara:strand:- start:275 stop:1339 length:1065 start_codon:yes stop_codon:yes gene_type:complete